MKRYIFGVFRDGKLIIPLGTSVNCTDSQASLLVALLDRAKGVLTPGDYFACDYVDEHKSSLYRDCCSTGHATR